MFCYFWEFDSFVVQKQFDRKTLFIIFIGPGWRFFSRIRVGKVSVHIFHSCENSFLSPSTCVQYKTGIKKKRSLLNWEEILADRFRLSRATDLIPLDLAPNRIEKNPSRFSLFVSIIVCRKEADMDDERRAPGENIILRRTRALADGENNNVFGINSVAFFINFVRAL